MLVKSVNIYGKNIEVFKLEGIYELTVDGILLRYSSDLNLLKYFTSDYFFGHSGYLELSTELISKVLDDIDTFFKNIVEEDDIVVSKLKTTTKWIEDSTTECFMENFPQDFLVKSIETKTNDALNMLNLLYKKTNNKDVFKVLDLVEAAKDGVMNLGYFDE